MSMLDMLLAADVGIFTDTPQSELEVSRLSKALGGPFIITVRALSFREFDRLPKGDDFKAHAILTATAEPVFKDQQLAQKLTPKDRKSPLTPVEVVYTLLLPGEVANIFNEISRLSGYDDEAVARIEKN